MASSILIHALTQDGQRKGLNPRQTWWESLGCHTEAQFLHLYQVVLFILCEILCVKHQCTLPAKKGDTLQVVDFSFLRILKEIVIISFKMKMRKLYICGKQ